MAGHSHWAGIKHKKAIIDAKRGKVFSKCSKAIIVAARSGGGDPGTNLSLKYAIDKAKAANMTRDAIERAIKKGTGELEGTSYEALMYEGYGPGGVAVLVEILTDNRNRTAAELRKLFEKRNATLAEPGAVAWQFEQKGQVLVAAEGADEEALMELALEAGADDFGAEGDSYQVLSDPKLFEAVRKAISDADFTVESGEVTFIPSQTVPVDAKTGKKLLDFLEVLDDHDDVQRLHANVELPDDMPSDGDDD